MYGPEKTVYVKPIDACAILALADYSMTKDCTVSRYREFCIQFLFHISLWIKVGRVRLSKIKKKIQLVFFSMETPDVVTKSDMHIRALIISINQGPDQVHPIPCPIIEDLD